MFKCTSCERSTSMPNMWTASLLLEFHLILFLRKYKKWTKNILHLKCITKMENRVKTSHENTTRHDILCICLTKPHIDHYVIYFELANNDHVNSNNAKCNMSTWNNQRIIFFHADFRLKCDTFLFAVGWAFWTISKDLFEIKPPWSFRMDSA